MYTRENYPLRQVLAWTRRDIYWLFGIAAVPTLLHTLAGWHWMALPWVPIALIGTSAAFTAGFRNNATYARLWEARQIFGAIVTNSRVWGLMVRDLIRSEGPCSEAEAAAAHARLIHRHIAWLTALRYQLRQPRIWESMQAKANAEYRERFYRVEEQSGDMAAVLAPWLSAEELAHVLRTTNRAAQLLALQGEDVGRLRSIGAVEANAHVALEQILAALLTNQGGCERIKNSPYPRQFASISLFFVRLFVYALPFGMVGEFAKLGPHAVWLAIPFSMIVGWIFVVLEAVGQASENPFEGSANDVPITALSRTIEIDLREMLGERDLPPPLTPVNNILM
jgi:ion channel-forming bestrophin family protein